MHSEFVGFVGFVEFFSVQCSRVAVSHFSCVCVCFKKKKRRYSTLGEMHNISLPSVCSAVGKTVLYVNHRGCT